jgi:hypothetical protein
MSEKNADGTDKVPNPQVDPFEELKGKVDDNGVPRHPEERADYYKTKFSESSKGAQDLLKQKQDLEKENADLKKPKFTQDELSNIIPGYDLLTPDQQKAIFESWSNQQRDLDELKGQVATMQDRQIFEDGFKELIKTEEFSILKKHRDSFKKYAYLDEYRGIDDLMIIARNYIMEKKLYTQKPEEENPKDPDRPGLDANRGGIRPAPKHTGFTPEEITTMRTKDPQRYNRLAAEGKLKVKED